ncbi:MAG TPA: S9 family peptidase [Thermoanaerobaculia bacterium]
MKNALLALALFALPLHADDLESRVAALAKIGSASSPAFSPDGKRIAFISTMSGSPQMWIVASNGGWPDQITTLDDPVTNIDWSPDGEWIALQSAPGGGLNEQVFVVRPDGTGLRRVTEGGKTNNRLFKWLPGSKSLLIGSSRRTPSAIDVLRADVATGAMTMVAQSNGVASVIDVSDDGRYALVSRLASRGDNNIYRVVMDGSAELLLTPHTPPASFVDAAFGASPDVILLAGDPDRDRIALGRVRVQNGKVTPFEVLASRTDAELQSVHVNHRHTVAALNWNVAGRSELSMLDLADMKERPGPKLPGDVGGPNEFSRDDSLLALTLGGADRPLDIWLLEMGTASLKQLTRSPHAGIDLSTLMRPELITYTASDGLPLSGWLYRPRDAKPPYAVVLSFHGGPEGQERPNLNSTYQALLASGIAVFAPNVRGSSGFGKKFVNLDNGALRVNGVRDIKSSVDHLVTSGLADPKRLGIMGGSYGGYMVMAGVTEYPDMFAAGADLFGVVNFETFFKQTEPWMAAISTKEYGDPATEAQMLYDLSPIHKVDRVKTPLIVLHGANDTNVPVVEAEQVVSSLKSRGVPVQYVLFPDEGHGWRKTANRLRSTVEIVKFFRERLKAI